MRLLLLSDAAAPHTRRWAKWFAEHGHEVHVATFNSNVLPGYSPAVVHVLWDAGTEKASKLSRMARLQKRLSKLVGELSPDVIHAHSVGGYAWAAHWLRFQPVVMSPWGTDILVDIRESRVNRLLTCSALRSSPLVVTDAQHFVEILVELGVSRGNIEVLAFGTDTDKFSGNGDERLRGNLGYGPGPVVISTRTPNPVHDVGTFVRAIPEILASVPATQFIVVGDGSELVSLQQLAADLGVLRSVTFTGMVDEEEMRDLLRISDVYVSTSFMDAGLAASTAEAMAVGLPVVHTDNSDNSHWAPEGVGGHLFANGDHSMLAQSVLSLLDQPELRAQMGRRNREKICADYSTDIEMSKMEHLYNSLLSVG